MERHRNKTKIRPTYKRLGEFEELAFRVKECEAIRGTISGFGSKKYPIMGFTHERNKSRQSSFDTDWSKSQKKSLKFI